MDSETNRLLTTTNHDEFARRPIRDELGDPVFDRETGWGVRIYDDRREFQNDGSSERVTGLTGNVTWRLATRTSLGVNAHWEESTSAAESGWEDTIVRFGAGLSRDLGRGADISLEHSYRDRDSTVEDLEFSENRVTATLSKVFSAPIPPMSIGGRRGWVNFSNFLDPFPFTRPPSRAACATHPMPRAQRCRCPQG